MAKNKRLKIEVKPTLGDIARYHSLIQAYEFDEHIREIARETVKDYLKKTNR